MRIGILFGRALGPDVDLDELLVRFAQAEADGFAAAWVPNVSGYDALTVLALAGRLTETIELGSFVIPTYPRHPVALAQQALTVQAAACNRLTLGVGLSHRHLIEDGLGLDYSKPIRHLREYLAVLNGLLDRQAVRYQGQEYRVAARLAVAGAARPSVLVAALGPQMLRLAGEFADGTAIWLGGPRYLERTAVPGITSAAREAGRPAPRVAAGFLIAVTNQRDAARASASQVFAAYRAVPSYRAVLEREGAGDPADIAIVGDEAEVAQSIVQLSGIGVTDFIAVPFAVQNDASAVERTYKFVAGLASQEA